MPRWVELVSGVEGGVGKNVAAPRQGSPLREEGRTAGRTRGRGRWLESHAGTPLGSNCSFYRSIEPKMRTSARGEKGKVLSVD
jgi:hypothetical protein